MGARHDALRQQHWVSQRAQATGPWSGTRFDDSSEPTRLTRVAVRRAKLGDEDAIRYLCVKYSNNIYGYVRSIVRDDHAAEVVTSQVFAKLPTSIVGYDDHGIPFVSWLLRLARRTALDHLQTIRTTPVGEAPSRDAEPEEGLDDMLAIRDAVATLPAEQREAAFLRYAIGLSPSELAGLTARTAGSTNALSTQLASTKQSHARTPRRRRHLVAV